MVNTYNLKQRFQIWFSNLGMLLIGSSLKGFIAFYFNSLISSFSFFKFLDLISFRLKSNLFISVPYNMRTEHAYQAVFINKL
jgi:hypothetical protein